MNKKEQEIVDTYANRLIEAITSLTTAIDYHARVIGYQGDAEADKPKLEATLVESGPEEIKESNDNAAEERRAEIEAKREAEKPEDTPGCDYTFLDIKAALNKFAKANGKTKTMEIVANYTGGKITAIKEEDYPELMGVINGA